MIDHIIFDVDGTLTDGGIIISSDGVETKRFHVRDGQIIGVLPSLEYTTVFLTGRKSELTQLRAKELKISCVLQGISDKAETLGNYMKQNSLCGNRIAYIGDDINDYAAMQLCGFSACPADAPDFIRNYCDYVSMEKGGYGAARDICEHLLRMQNQYEQFVKLFVAGEGLN
ncbi:MAG: HAD hydrolase family protein [Defluviitaleaceae bacterium]|nr:HAD hydrolase family protein [Defluviitaleaceae bacterium]